jgi:ribonuclease HI
MNEKNAGWVRMRFKKNKVWVALDAAGRMRVENDKLLIKYQLDQPHEYWVLPRHVHPLDDPMETAARKTDRVDAVDPNIGNEPIEADALNQAAILIYTDGASSGNPGPSGIGVLLQYGEHQKEVSRYIGMATNNIAELEAIRVGLGLIRNPDKPVRVYTDSSYALGLLSKGWKAKKNQTLVNDIRRQISRFKDIRFIKVKGHAGHAQNERADKLATQAIATGQRD